VVGLGFGVTDPVAVEQLDQAGMDVRVVPDSDTFSASAFHPKLYLVQGKNKLTTFSASANLTGGGWTTNVEQYEELTFADPSPESSAHHHRPGHHPRDRSRTRLTSPQRRALRPTRPHHRPLPGPRRAR
jgi:hypothetical protein